MQAEIKLKQKAMKQLNFTMQVRFQKHSNLYDV